MINGHVRQKEKDTTYGSRRTLDALTDRAHILTFLKDGWVHNTT